MSFYNPDPCPACGMDRDNIDHREHALTDDENVEYKKLQRLFVSAALGGRQMHRNDASRLRGFERRIHTQR